MGGGFACAALTSHPGGVGVHVLLITLINDKLLKLRQDELNLATLPYLTGYSQIYEAHAPLSYS